MKKVLAAFVIAVAAIVYFLAGCAGTPKAIPDEEAWSRFVGEWMCPDTATVGNLFPALQVYEADLLGKWYYFSVDTKPNLELRFKLKKSWVDAQGYVYCQVHFQNAKIGEYSSAFECAGLMRIDATGKVLEINAISGVSEKGSMADWAYKQLEQIDTQLAVKLPASSSGGSQMGGWLGIYWIYHRK